MKLRASHTIYSDCMRVVRNSVFVISYCALHFIPAVRASYEIQYFLYRIFRLPACCMKLRASHTIYSDCMRVVRNSVFLIPYIRLHACCMKLSVRHIILRFTFHSGCPRVIRNSVFLIPYIPFARALHETQCSSYHTALYISFRLSACRTKFSVLYHIFRLPACCMKLRASYTIYSDCMRVVRNSVFLIPYIPFACVLHETPCFSYYIFRLHARCMKLS